MIIQAIFIGLIQGLTEFLPVSSSAHIRVFTELIGAGDWGSGFTAICQIGTEIAVILYFRKKIYNIITSWFKALVTGKSLKEKFGSLDFNARMGWYVIIGTIPVVILGLLLKHFIEGPFRNLYITSFALIFFGVLLGYVDQKFKQIKTTDNLDIKSGILFGLGQAMAIIPGVSRSGGTMTVGRSLGFTRKDAAEYSFLLAIPAVFGSGIFELLDVVKNTPPNFPGVFPTILATVIAFIVGYISIIGFIKIVSTYSYRGFVIYRVIFGIIILILLLGGLLNPI